MKTIISILVLSMSLFIASCNKSDSHEGHNHAEHEQHDGEDHSGHNHK